MKALGCLLWLGLSLSCVPQVPREPGVVVVAQEQQATWIRNFNPLVPTSARWPTSAGVYEPLYIFNQATGEWVPWLATDSSWSEDATELSFEIRQGVRWSDGQPFSAQDVAFTFNMMKSVPGADLGGVWGFLESVEARDTRVIFTFQRPYVSGLQAISQQAILPEHIWSAIEFPLLEQNPDPVGTGPFTEVSTFRGQVFQLDKNPYYWQELGVEALRFPALSSNDQASIALIRGELDWAGIFVPAVERTYLARDENYQAWFPTQGGTIFLYANTQVEPLNNPKVREALSLAINRERLVEVAMYNYTTPTRPTALSDGYRDWEDGRLKGWTHYDAQRAGELLDQAGLTKGRDGMRTQPDGSELTLSITSPAGWSDWVRAVQVIAGDLRSIGLDVQVKGYDFSAWYERVGRGDFELSLGWSEQGPSPVPMYKALMDPAAVEPVGEASFRNWHRYGSEKAAPLFAAFDATPDPVEQARIVGELQEIFVDEVPAIPLFPAPAWGEANHTHITGFPSAKDPYAPLSPNSVPACLLVMTRLEAK